MPQRFRIKWSDAAVRDIESILDYLISEEAYQAADKLSKKLLKGIDSLTHLPQRGRMVPELKAIGVTVYRELILPPYRIIFRVYPKEIALVGILDSRRDLEEIILARTFETEYRT